MTNAHPSRCCANCVHVDPDFECLQMVFLADGSRKPEGFACHEHQTVSEYRLDLHRPNSVMLSAVGGRP